MNEDLHNCIKKLKKYAERAVFNKDDLEKLEERITPLEVTRESILRYEKKGVPVPKGVRDEEEKLVAEIDKLTLGSEFGEVYEALLHIAARLGRTSQRTLQKDLRKAIIADDNNTTSPQVFRDLVIQFLKESGGVVSSI
jgi:DNA repair ATPase RecN